MQPGAADEEVLETGRPPRRGRIAMLAALVAAAVVGTLIVTHGHGPARRSARPTPSAASPGRAALLTPVRWPAAVIGGTVYTVDQGSVKKYDARSGTLLGRRLIHARDEADYEVVADAAHHRIWVVSTVDDISVYELDSRSLALLSRTLWNGNPFASALVDGRLYVSTTTGVVVLPRVANRPLLAPVPLGAIIAPDPRGHRLIELGPVRLGRLQVSAVDIADVAGAAWLVGVRGVGAVVARLDPRTLTLGAHSPIEAQLAPGAQLAGADDRHLFLRSAASASALWCIDGRTGGLLQRWATASGTPVVVGDVVYELTASGPRRLASGRCSGQ